VRITLVPDKWTHLQVVYGFQHNGTVNFLLSKGIAQSQSAKTEVVDLSRDALTPGRNHHKGFGRKQVTAIVASRLQPVVDVRTRLGAGERTEPAQDGDALA
jgi:hypothetical protein